MKFNFTFKSTKSSHFLPLHNYFEKDTSILELLDHNSHQKLKTHRLIDNEDFRTEQKVHF